MALHVYEREKLHLVVSVDQMQIVRCRFGKVSGIPEIRPSFLTVLLGNCCGASQQFAVQHSCVMSGCHISAWDSVGLAAKRNCDAVSTA